MTIFDPLISEVSSILGEQAGLSADTILRNAMTDGATADFSDAATSRATLDSPAHDIDYADFVMQVAALEAESALPVDGEYFICIIHPHTFATLMQDETFVNLFIEEADKGDSALRSGYLGRILNCKLYRSANAREYADTGVGSTTDVYSMLFIARESYGYVGMAGITPDVVDNQNDMGKPLTGQKIKPVELIVKQLGAGDDPLNQRATIGWKMSLGTMITNSAWIRNLEHTNAFSDL